eukprot:9996002-Lingulodinium_polyedra.AAC.1
MKKQQFPLLSSLMTNRRTLINTRQTLPQDREKTSQLFFGFNKHPGERCSHHPAKGKGDDSVSRPRWL